MGTATRVAIVTGGARGIGRAIAERFARDGIRVVVADILESEAVAAAAEIGGNTLAVALDVCRQSSIDDMIARVVEQAGGVDILINSAGVFDMCPVLDVSRASFQKVFSVNVEGLFFTLQGAAAQMVRQGRGGKIINLASQAGRRGEPLVSVYCASKAAVISLTQSAGVALIKHGINVNAIAPGVIDTPMYDFVDSLCVKFMGTQPGENKRQVGLGVPYGRMGKPEELASMAAFLISPDAEYVVAQTYGVDGGNWMA